MILIATSGLLAALDESQRSHAAAADALRNASGARLLSPFVLAELDYLIATRVGTAQARALLAEVARGAYRLEPFDDTDVAAALTVIDHHPDMELGVADASIVVLAERHRVGDVLTLDERHFRALRGPGGDPFRLLPSDS